MNSKILLGIVVVLAGLGIGWFVLQGAPGARLTGRTTPTPSPSNQQVSVTPGTNEVVAPSTKTGQSMEKGGIQVTTSTPTKAVVATTTISYTDSGFTPNTITVKVGTTVRFTNLSSRGMWVASAVHPTHQLLPGFDELKSVEKDGTYEYTFVKVGTWKYHNHVGATDTGTVVVTQ